MGGGAEAAVAQLAATAAAAGSGAGVGADETSLLEVSAVTVAGLVPRACGDISGAEATGRRTLGLC